MPDKRSKDTCKRKIKKKYFGEPCRNTNQDFHGDNLLRWGNIIIPTEDLFMLSKKTFILHGVMLHLDGICYMFHDAMRCKEDYYLCMVRILW